MLPYDGVEFNSECFIQKNSSLFIDYYYRELIENKTKLFQVKTKLFQQISKLYLNLNLQEFESFNTIYINELDCKHVTEISFSIKFNDENDTKFNNEFLNFLKLINNNLINVSYIRLEIYSTRCRINLNNVCLQTIFKLFNDKKQIKYFFGEIIMQNDLNKVTGGDKDKNEKKTNNKNNVKDNNTNDDITLQKCNKEFNCENYPISTQIIVYDNIERITNSSNSNIFPLCYFVEDRFFYLNCKTQGDKHKLSIIK
jgi:hypothetical protein